MYNINIFGYLGAGGGGGGVYIIISLVLDNISHYEA